MSRAAGGLAGSRRVAVGALMRGRFAPVVAAGVLLAATAVAAGTGTLGLRLPEQPPAQRAPAPATPLPLPTAARPPPEPPGGQGWPWLGDVVLVLVILAGLAAAAWGLRVLLRRRAAAGPRRQWYGLRALRTGRGVRAPGPDRGREVLAAVDEAVARSEDDRDPRRAVIACWARLEEAAAEAGVARAPADTATDLVLRLLRSYQVSEPALGAFVEAYWLARYATHPVDERMRTQARSALQRLREELRREVPVP